MASYDVSNQSVLFPLVNLYKYWKVEPWKAFLYSANKKVWDKFLHKLHQKKVFPKAVSTGLISEIHFITPAELQAFLYYYLCIFTIDCLQDKHKEINNFISPFCFDKNDENVI